MSQDKITIRPVCQDDLTAFRALRLEALCLHPEAFSADCRVNEAFQTDYWQGRIRNAIDSQDQIIFVAEAEDGLVGMIGINRGNSPKTTHSAGVWGVYVKSAYRGQGLADRLLEACRQWAETAGVRVIKLGVVTTNQAAIRSYARCGYVPYGTEPMAICVDGRDYDETLMALRL